MLCTIGPRKLRMYKYTQLFETGGKKRRCRVSTTFTRRRHSRRNICQTKMFGKNVTSCETTAVNERRKRNLHRRKCDREIRDSMQLECRRWKKWGENRYIKDGEEINSKQFNDNLIINCSRINLSNYMSKETWSRYFNSIVAFFRRPIN